MQTFNRNVAKSFFLLKTFLYHPIIIFLIFFMIVFHVISILLSYHLLTTHLAAGSRSFFCNSQLQPLLYPILGLSLTVVLSVSDKYNLGLHRAPVIFSKYKGHVLHIFILLLYNSSTFSIIIIFKIQLVYLNQVLI